MSRPSRVSRRRPYGEILSELERVQARVMELTSLRQVQQELTTHQEQLEQQNQQLLESQVQLQESHERYVELFDLAPIAYVTIDETGIIEDMNVQASMLLETERARRAGMPFFLSVAQPDRRRFFDFLSRCRRNHERTEVELQLRTCTGKTAPALLTARHSRSSTMPRSLIMGIIDLRERYAAEAHRRQAEAEQQRMLREQHAADAANAAKDRFLAVLSHELRTPLTPLLMAIEAAERRGFVTERMRPLMELVRRNVELEARLIDDLLDVTRIRHSKLRLDLETVDLHALIAEVLDTFRPQLDAAGLAIETRLLARDPWLRADPDRIRQVVWNLLQNSLRNTPQGGTITISTTSQRRQVVLRVQDTGRGIAPDALERLFLPFEQVPGHRGGLGLGLAICRGLVEAHGGTITAASDGTDRGATFEVTLPTVAAPRTAATLPTPQAPATSSLRVLLVEDNQDTAHALVELLGLCGFRVEHASSLAAAYMKDTDDFDVIVSDLGLPDGSGLELIRGMRSERPVPAIALSGYGMAEDVERSLAAGFALHLTKPVTPADLVEAIRKVAR